ncbi:hypothetical protein, partial [Burkholderia vietnamiensis]|uniref:hypothetical protein n=1 Tax=Burkholderia vietnamiensis TaxID=60552 RepID=UPI001E47E5E8
MQSILQESDGSPLKKFYSVESNLTRERRVFSVVIALLVALALAVSIITIVGLFQTAFRQEGSMSFRVESNTVTGASPARTGWPAGA